jgi:epoxide hydrolase-like predicted phosphatase
MRVRDLFAADPRGREALVELEIGEIDERQFEVRLAALLELDEERVPGLVDRVFGSIVAEEAIFEALRIARANGIRTGLLSNSWGIERYPHDLLPELFDAVVISGQEGVRKPDQAIYEVAIERLGVPASEIVFVDDLPGNLKPARELGMTTVHHTSAADTLDQLEKHFALPLR